MTQLGSWKRAASAAFSPSVTTTFASDRIAKSVSPQRGRGAVHAFHRQPLLPDWLDRQNVNGEKCLAPLESSKR